MPQIGVLLDQHAYNLSGKALAETAQFVESLGFESVWLLDSFSRDPYLTASYILGKTEKLKVGTGIATVYSRDAMATVQARETLSEYYPGRFIMGLGASNETIVQMRGGSWKPPVQKMAEYLGAMAKTQLFHPAPGQLAPLHIAAHAPGLQKLAREYANGIITWILPVDSVRTAAENVRPALEVTANFPCVLNSDPAAARAIAREFLSAYLKIDYYRAAYSKIGFGPEDFDNDGSDRLIDAIVAWGDAAKIKQRVDEYAAAGATRVVLNPIRASRGEVAGSEYNADADLESLKELGPVLL